MKKINIVSLVFLVIGAILALISGIGFSNDPVSGFIYLWIGYLLILVSIILFIVGLFIKSKIQNE